MITDQSDISNMLAVEGIVNQAVSYLRNWTREELVSFVSASTNGRTTPLIAQINKNSYIVGNYAIAKTGPSNWKVIYKYSDSEYHFSNKLSAVLFSVYQQTGQINSADTVLLRDENVSRLSIKAEHYLHRYKQAVKKKNIHKIDLFLIRYQETMLKLDASKRLLEKTLKSAKYIKS